MVWDKVKRLAWQHVVMNAPEHKASTLKPHKNRRMISMCEDRASSLFFLTANENREKEMRGLGDDGQ